ncbi:5240_t:CDS:2 [Funneliformis geosporum]|nr:5240_t:CDS:2 [Funneliformis geosporum]
MAKIATDFMNRHKWTSETPLPELAKYTEEINERLTKEQVEVFIPIRPSGKHEEGRATVDKIA